MAKFYLQKSGKMLGIAFLILTLGKSALVAQEYPCDSLYSIYNNNPDPHSLGWSFESSAEPAEGVEKFLKRKATIEKIRCSDWNLYCQANIDILNVRVSFVVLPDGKPTCFEVTDTTCIKLNQIAINFLRETSFKPAMKNGLDALQQVSYPFFFKRCKKL